MKALEVKSNEITEALSNSKVVHIEDDSVVRNEVFSSFDIVPQSLYFKGFPMGITYQDVKSVIKQITSVEPLMVTFHKDIKGSRKSTCEVVFDSVESAGLVFKHFGSQETENVANLEKLKGLRLTDETSYQVLEKNLICLPLATWKAENNDEQKRLINTVRSFVTGLLLKVKNIGVLGTSNGHPDEHFEPISDKIQDQIVSRQILMQVFEKFGEVKFIRFCFGDTEAQIRFMESSPDGAAKAVAHCIATPIILGGNQVECCIIEGEEEREIWNNILNPPQTDWQKKGNNSRQGGNRQGGNRYGRKPFRKGGRQ